jgi:adhesin/invasin
MTPKMNHKEASIADSGKPARQSFLQRFGSACLLFLLGASLHSMASPATPPHSAGASASPLPPYHINIFVTQDNQLADGSHNDIVQVTVTDDALTAPNNQAVGVTVNFKLQGASASNSVTTNGAGVAVYPVNNMTAGPTDLSITVNGATQVVTINFIAAPPDPNPPGGPGSPGGTPGTPSNNTYYVTTIDNSPADGSTPDYVLVHLADPSGNSQGPNIAVDFTITGGSVAGTAVFGPNGSPTIYHGFTNGSGDILLPITSTKVGDVMIRATLVVGGIDIINSPQTVHFIVGPPSSNPPGGPGAPGGTPGTPSNDTYYIVTTDNKTADGSSQDFVLVHLSDLTGNSQGPNIEVDFTITGGLASGTAVFGPTGSTTTFQGFTDGNGDILLPLTSTKAGDVIIKATLFLDGTDIVNSPQTVHFVSGPPSSNPPGGPGTPGGAPGTPADDTYYIVTTDNQAADAVSQDFVKVHLSDKFGNPEGAGYQVDFTITGGVASGTAIFGPNSSTTTYRGTTDANGDMLIPVTSTKMGDLIIKATLVTDGTVIVNSPQTVHFVAGAPVPSAPGAPGGVGTLLTITHNDEPADGVKADSANAYITDKYGNHVGAGIPVTFTIHAGGSANGGALFQPGGVTTITVLTDKNGNAVVPITDTLAGDAWIDASINAGSIIDGSYATARFTEAPSVTNRATALIVVVYEAIADGQGNTVVKAHVVDAAGNSLPGWDVTFAIDSGSATMVTPAISTTDANGDAFITLSSNKAGYVLITATVNGKSIIYGSPARVKFVPINIYVPRVFTPNNDGSNDVLKPILVGIATFHYMNVYNRWGNLIFTTQDPNRGWDGTFKGVAQPVETYLWIAEGIDIEGKTIVQKGMTSLVR